MRAATEAVFGADAERKNATGVGSGVRRRRMEAKEGVVFDAGLPKVLAASAGKKAVAHDARPGGRFQARTDRRRSARPFEQFLHCAQIDLRRDEEIASSFFRGTDTREQS